MYLLTGYFSQPLVIDFCLVTLLVAAAVFLARRHRPLVSRLTAAAAACALGAIVTITIPPPLGLGELLVQPRRTANIAAVFHPSTEALSPALTVEGLLNVGLYLCAALVISIHFHRPVRVAISLIVLSATVESCQAWTATRSGTFADLFENSVGACLGVLAMSVLAPRRRGEAINARAAEQSSVPTP